MSRLSRVLFVQYTNPGNYPPIEHAAQLLAEVGARVLVLGMGGRREALQMAPFPRVRVRMRGPAPAAGWRQKLHYGRWIAWVVACGAAWRPDWIYASDPMSAPAAIALQSITGARVVYHEHDSPALAGEALHRTSRSAEALARARLTIARRATVCVLPNAERARVFRDVTGAADVVTVWNTPTLAEVSGRHAASGDMLRVLYHGTLVPARLPFAVLEAIALAGPRVSLTAVGYETAGHEGYRGRLAARAAELGIGDRCAFAPPLSRGPLMRACAQSDVGLALLTADTIDPNERTMVGASNKVFDYLACGLVPFVPDEPAWREAFVDDGVALAVDPRQATSLARALQWCLDHPAERQAMGERGRQRILETWNYETAFAPVLARMRGTARAAAFRADSNLHAGRH